MKLNEADIHNLENILEDLQENETEFEKIEHFISVDIECLTHIMAKLKNQICPECKEDFSCLVNNNNDKVE